MPSAPMRKSAGLAMRHAVDSGVVPDSVRAKHLPAVVDEDVERQLVVLDVPLHLLGPLGDDDDDADAERGEVTRTLGQFTEPAVASGSPDAAVEGEQQRAPRER